MKKNKLVYIIPTYNEKENIEAMLKFVQKMLSTLSKYDSSILVVDDNSPDGTGKIVKRLMQHNRSIFLLKGNKNGLGMAIIRGYKYAIKNLGADIVVTNEADFSYSPSCVPEMMKLLENDTDVVFGSRKLTALNKWSTGRKTIHWVANTLFAKIVAGVTQVEDHNSAFKIVRVKSVLNKINFDNFPKGFAFFNYLTFRISQTTPKISEFFVTYTPRSKGSSKISLTPKYLKYFLKDTAEYILTCLRIRKEKLFP
ncbi:MAG TPA: glycosyltransferase [Patescibacteria group bacterium]|nr:glycosyltransferase [Patescibacteria group bacterium]